LEIVLIPHERIVNATSFGISSVITPVPVSMNTEICKGLRAILPPVLMIAFALASRPAPEAKAAPVADKGALTFHSCDGARFHFGGMLGARIDANVAEWLLRAPQANPGMLEMFRVRDRQPVPNLVPWAGEFVGKYLISAIQALRMSDNLALRQQVSNVVAELISTQADDGYLGPFPQATRLRGNWDLWGHYHVMQALMLWHEATGDAASLQASKRAGDLVCNTFLDSPLHVYDAGSHEMNMAVIHGLGELHRRTGETRYLRMMREIEKDWERAGDYFRSGLAGVEFFQSPRPRWESLHNLQGLVELYRITGDARYRQAFEHHWRSITRWDRHNTGGFSSGEQATGNAYSPAAIETCCTVAWMALTIDMLRLTGDPLCADELELSTFNGAAGAQHPSGRWWTYNTPMDGVREASAHSIVFQARAGTPELNCCSVNAPRSLGMLSQWAVMNDDAGLIVNYYGPGSFEGKLMNGTRVRVTWETDYPRSDTVRMRIEPDRPSTFRVKFRIPAWSAKTRMGLHGRATEEISPGRYLEVNREWTKGSAVELNFDMRLRFVTGDREATGKVSLYRGPLLLAYDQRFNIFDERNIPPLDLRRLGEAKAEEPGASGSSLAAELAPWLLVSLPCDGGQTLRFCDFASAGATGTRYRSWLVAKDCPPPPVVTRWPRDGASIPIGSTIFRWTGPARTNERALEYQMFIAEHPSLTNPLVKLIGLRSNALVLGPEMLGRLRPGRTNYWQVTALNAHGTNASVRPPARFVLDPSLPVGPAPSLPAVGPDGLQVHASLQGVARPQVGQLAQESLVLPAEGPNGTTGQAVRLDGQSQKLVYQIEEFPEEDYTMAVWVRIDESPSNRIGQIFSAWCAAMDDPLRVCVDRGKLFARIEAGQGYSTPGLGIEPGRWRHIAAVKAGDRLTLFIDGKPGPAAVVPMFSHSNSREVALGGNPRFSGNECLAASFADFRFYARALSEIELAESAARK
jgi:DUF1680 family protein